MQKWRVSFRSFFLFSSSARLSFEREREREREIEREDFLCECERHRSGSYKNCKEDDSSIIDVDTRDVDDDDDRSLGFS